MNTSTWREAESAALADIANAGQQGDTLTAIPCTHGTPHGMLCDACWKAADEQAQANADQQGNPRAALLP